jgi:hypothetical protein
VSFFTFAYEDERRLPDDILNATLLDDLLYDKRFFRLNLRVKS